MRLGSWLAAGLCVLAGLSLTCGDAQADSFTYDLDVGFGEGTDPNPSGIVKLTIADIGLESVRITWDATDLTGANEKIGQLYMNLDSAITFVDLDFSYVSGGTGDPTTTVSYASNGKKADGEKGEFDIFFDLATSGDIFAAGDVLIYDVTWKTTGTGLSAAAFALSTPAVSQSSEFFAAIHVQGIGAWGTSKFMGADGPTPVPEPGTIALLGIGLLAGAAARRRRARTAA